MIDKLIQRILNFFKTIFFNFKVFPFYIAIKMPIYVTWDTYIELKRGSLIINSKAIRRGMIKLGYRGAPFVPYKKSTLIIKNGGELQFGDNCVIAEGYNIYIDSGYLEISDNVYSNRNLMIQCENTIKINEGALLGWNVCMRDTDGHEIEGGTTTKKNDIILKRMCWIASDVAIMRGSLISEYSIVGTRSLVLGFVMNEDKCMLAGSPASIKRKGVMLHE